MDPIQDMLDKITELSDEQLGELESQALAEFETQESQDLTSQTVDRMSQLADAVDAVRAEKDRRAAEAAELAERVAQVKNRVKGTEAGEAVGEPEGEPIAAEAAAEDKADGGTEPHEFAAGPDGKCTVCGKAADDPVHVVAASATAQTLPVETVVPAEGAAAVEPITDEIAIAASGEQASDAIAEEAQPINETGKDQSGAVTAAAAVPGGEPLIEAPADRKPVARVSAPVAITAGAGIPGVKAGTTLDSASDIADAMTKRLNSMNRSSPSDGEEFVTIASLVASFPEDRVLTPGDALGNMEKINAVVSPQAITASGGLCAPVDTNYDIFGVGDRGRPVKDALPAFNAARGGIRFLTSPTLADVAGAVSLWTLQDDIDAGTPGLPDPVKPCIRVNCGEEVTVYTDAIPLCLTFGNLNARAFPELVARHNELALIQHDRFAETRLLTRIGSLSTPVTAGYKVSAAVDFFNTIDRALASYRNRHRIANLAPMRLMLPEWFREMLRADLSYRMPGDGLEANLAIADAVIDRFFAVRAVNVTWFMDGETGQVFGAQTAGEVIDWPDNVIWYMFAEGTFLFLDGGTLDLGLVRDSTLIGTNDYKMFLETFEGVAKVGLEALRVTQRVEVTGMVAGTLDTRPVALRV